MTVSIQLPVFLVLLQRRNFKPKRGAVFSYGGKVKAKKSAESPDFFVVNCFLRKKTTETAPENRYFFFYYSIIQSQNGRLIIAFPAGIHHQRV